MIPPQLPVLRVLRWPRPSTQVDRRLGRYTVHFYWDRRLRWDGSPQLIYAGSSIDEELRAIAEALFGWLA